MSELKQHQSPMSVEEQIENLKSLGIIIEDETYVKEILNSVSYFRLIKAYGLTYKDSNGSYIPGTSILSIISLYLFDRDFRRLLFSFIEDIEITMRCQISNYFCVKYGVLVYYEAANFENEEYHQEFIDNYNEELGRNLKNPFVKNFQNNYEGGKLPFYAAIELLSFGELSKFYRNMHPADKKEVARNSYSIGYTYLQSWLESLSYVRNICAHYGRLYNVKLSKAPVLYGQYSDVGIHNYFPFAIILCLKEFYKKDRSHWQLFVNSIDAYKNMYSCVNLSVMGFPDDWKELLLN